MPGPVSGLRRFLAEPRVYDGFQRAVGASRAHARFVNDHVRPFPRARILDLGCGPGNVLRVLPDDVSYIGIDASEAYIDAGRRVWGSRGQFRCADIRDADAAPGEFDIAIAMGMLHHLDDGAASALFALAARALTENGRFASFDGAYVQGQTRAARWLLERDRGEHVGPPERYRALAEPWFGDVRVTVRHDLLRVPYTHAILECAAPVPRAGA